MEGKAETGTQAVDRAMAILFSFTEAQPEWRVADLSRALALNKSTVHRLLQALVTAGLVRRDERSSTYRLGPALLDLSGRFLSTLDLRAEARPLLEELARTHGESVNLAMIEGTDAILVDRVAGTNNLQLVSRQGRRIPIYCSGAGKALILDLSDAAVRALLGDVAFTPLTDHTIDGIDEFIKRLQVWRRQGWVANDEESEPGLISIAAPVRDHTSGIAASISVSAPTFRVDAARRQLLADAVRHTARDISLAIGAGIAGQSLNSPPRVATDKAAR